MSPWLMHHGIGLMNLELLDIGVGNMTWKMRKQKWPQVWQGKKLTLILSIRKKQIFKINIILDKSIDSNKI